MKAKHTQSTHLAHEEERVENVGEGAEVALETGVLCEYDNGEDGEFERLLARLASEDGEFETLLARLTGEDGEFEGLLARLAQA